MPVDCEHPAAILQHLRSACRLVLRLKMAQSFREQRQSGLIEASRKATPPSQGRSRASRSTAAHRRWICPSTTHCSHIPTRNGFPGHAWRCVDCTGGPLPRPCAWPVRRSSSTPRATPRSHWPRSASDSSAGSWLRASSEPLCWSLALMAPSARVVRFGVKRAARPFRAGRPGSLRRTAS